MPVDQLSVDQARKVFARQCAEGLASDVKGGLRKRPEERGWTRRAVWFENDDTLMAVVGGQEGPLTDLGLAHGLHLAAGRRLILLLHQDWAYPTLFRQPWLQPEIEVWTHDVPAFDPSLSGRSGKAHVTSVEPLDPVQTRNDAGEFESSHYYRLGPKTTPWIRDLMEWATQQEQLVDAHRGTHRAWAHNGQRVLTIKGKRVVEIKAGIDSKTEPAKVYKLDGPPSAAELKEIQTLVKAAIGHARAKKYGPFEEHHLQVKLRRWPNALLLEEPILREVPAWRPARSKPELRGRGFIDLVGLNSGGDLVVVETKLDSDDMLILQGLDYWIWATKPENKKWLQNRLYASPDADVHLLYAVAGKGGDTPKLGKYQRAQLEALVSEISWRFALLEKWNDDGSPKSKVLAPGEHPH